MHSCSTPARALRSRRGLALALSVLVTVPLLPLSATALSGVALAAPVDAERTPEQERTAEREQQARADLAESSAVVQAAAVALSSVAAQLPQAQNDVARARGGLAGAQARLAAANAELERAQQARAEAAAQVAQADARVDRGRQEVGLIARRTYQRGRLGDVREVMESGDPQEALERAGMLRAVFRYQDASLARLTTARLSLARQRAGLAAEERAVERARARAEEREARARAITAEAEQAEARVASLVATRSAALQSAEGERAADQRDYQQAQAASRALAERIRAAAAEAARRQAAAEAARRKAEAEAARRAAAAAAQREAAARAARRAAAAQSAAQAAAARRAAEERAAAERRAERSTRTRPAAPVRPQSVPSSGMLWPCGGCPLTSTFGWRTHPIFGDARFHAGIDMGASTGTPVRAADSGTVIVAGSAGGYGTLVVVSHGLVGGRDLSTAYAHMSRISVSVGQSVSRGQEVGEVGDEGNSTGPHLHFEVRRNGDPVDPLDFVGGS